MTKAAPAFLVILALAVSGCGGSHDDGCATRAAGTRGSLGTVELVSTPERGPTDYDPVAGPEELRGLVDLVVDGIVTDVADGRSIGAANAGPRRHFVVTLRPAKVYKAPGGDAPDLVHLEFRRPDDVPVADFRSAIPDGTRVVVFGDKLPEIADEPVRNQFGGRSDGGPLYAPAPQGLYLAVDQKALPRGMVYPDHGIDGFKDLDAFADIAPRAVGATPSSREAASAAKCA